MSRVRLIPHEESYEVSHPSGARTFFYFDDNPGRRSITGRMSSADALEKAKVFAQAEQDKLDAADPKQRLDSPGGGRGQLQRQLAIKADMAFDEGLQPLGQLAAFKRKAAQHLGGDRVGDILTTLGFGVTAYEQGEIGPDLCRHACLMGLEGLVSKHRERAYGAGRCTHWIKIKNPQHPAYRRVQDQF